MGPAANTTTDKSKATDALTEEQTAAMAEQRILLATSGSATPSANAAPQDSVVERAGEGPHHRHHPKAPIDCPLRKAGIDPHGLKPFTQVEKYIAFLEQRTVQSGKGPMPYERRSISPEDVVVDLGAGSGYFRFAQVVTRGQVVALDT